MVVLGILCALTGSWWEGVQEREIETEYLFRLETDLQMSRDSLISEMALHRRNADSIRLVLTEFRTGPNPGGDELLRNALGFSTSIAVWIPYHTTYEELLSTGNLALISSSPLRAALGAYDRLVRGNADWDDWIEKQYLATVEPVVMSSLVYSDIVPGWAQRRNIPSSRFEQDFSSLYMDWAFWNAVSIKLEIEVGVLEARGRLLKSLESALELPQEEIGPRDETVHNAHGS